MSLTQDIAEHLEAVDRGEARPVQMALLKQAGERIAELTLANKQLFELGQSMFKDCNALQRRIDEAVNSAGNDVERYEHRGAMMCLSRWGEWIGHVDYERLALRNAELQERHNRLLGTLERSTTTLHQVGDDLRAVTAERNLLQERNTTLQSEVDAAVVPSPAAQAAMRTCASMGLWYNGGYRWEPKP